MGPRSHKGPRSNPNTIVQADRLDDEPHVTTRVVRARRDECLLGNHGMTANHEWPLIMQPRPMTNPCMVANGQIPWHVDADGPGDFHAPAYRSTEQIEHATSQPRTQNERILNNQG